MEDLIKRFENLKGLLIQRGSPLMGEALTNAFISELSEYNDLIKMSFDHGKKVVSDIKDENELLRSLVGVSDVDLSAKLLKQQEEIRFLRNQLFETKNKHDLLRLKNEAQLIKIEELKNEIKKGLKVREGEQNDHQENLKTLDQRLNELDIKYQEQIGEIEKEKNEVLYKFHSVEKDILKRFNKELIEVFFKMRDLCGILHHSSQSAKERIEKEINNEAGLKDLMNKSIQELDTIINNSVEVVEMLNTYLALLQDVAVNNDKINILKFLGEFKKRYYDISIKKSIKIGWPSTKKYPDFSSDEANLNQICNIIMDNLIESMAKQINIEAEFSGKEMSLIFQDDASPLKQEEIRIIINNFCEGKINQKYLKLNKALKLAIYLDGSIKFEPKEKGNKITVSIKNQT